MVAPRTVLRARWRALLAAAVVPAALLGGSAPAGADAGTSYSFAPAVSVGFAATQQGLAYADGIHYVGFDTGSGNGRIIGYDGSGTKVRDSGDLPLGHTAEVSFRRADGNLYVATGGGTNPTKVNVVDLRRTPAAVVRTYDFSALGNNGMVAIDDERDRMLVFSGRNADGQWVFTWSDYAGHATPAFTLTDAGTPQGLEIVNDQVLYYTSSAGHNAIRVLGLTGATAYTIALPETSEGEGLSTDVATNRVYVGYALRRVDRMSPVLTAPVGINLLSNPGGESGTGGNDSSIAKAVPSWTESGWTAITYATGGGYPDSNDPGPSGRGAVFFAGGTSATGTMSQNVALSGLPAADTDAGHFRYTLKGWLGGYLTQEDNAKVVATFRDVGGASLGTATIGPVTATDRGGVTGLLERTRTATLPAGTRSISVVLTGTRVSGTNLDAYADNLSLELARQ